MSINSLIFAVILRRIGQRTRTLFSEGDLGLILVEVTVAAASRERKFSLLSSALPSRGFSHSSA